MFKSDGSFMDLVDYSKEISIWGDVVKHSGDILDPDQGTGVHTLDIMLQSLPQGRYD